MANLHPAIEEILEVLEQMFPGTHYLTLDEYATFFDITRTYAAEHFRKKNEGAMSIPHTPVGRKIMIFKPDFAYWLAQQKLVNGKPIKLQELGQDGRFKRARGFTF